MLGIILAHVCDLGCYWVFPSLQKGGLGLASRQEQVGEPMWVTHQACTWHGTNANELLVLSVLQNIAGFADRLYAGFK